ncbi:XK-like protein (macronuclear) [Tetrahymena thermophila SB210]|uniref:XK-like protein n=1 Tax=Tetrahymena thermophila (strain SB210) TaxID=312017 RepID=Q23ZC3_TETTS|nr:XK-like protein [Tetrahymena thermophila SB210]EAS01934.2 XK-like protein [Tetrahymena thermophila SB210]|eukprot:XP_001022179.2 XK-like protein [Tetrahymena thermophila SB210]
MKNNYLKESKLQEQKLRLWMNLQPSFVDTFFYDDNQIFEQNICFLVQAFLESAPQLIIQLINNNMNDEWDWFNIISILLSSISIVRTIGIIYVIIDRFFRQITYLSQYYDKDKKFAINKQLVVDTLQLSKNLQKVRNLHIVEDLFIYFQKHEYPLAKDVIQIGLSFLQMHKLRRLTLDFRFILDKKCINSFKQLQKVIPQLKNLEVLYIKCDFEYDIEYIDGRNYREIEKKKRKLSISRKIEREDLNREKEFDEQKLEIRIPSIASHSKIQDGVDLLFSINQQEYIQNQKDQAVVSLQEASNNIVAPLIQVRKNSMPSSLGPNLNIPQRKSVYGQDLLKTTQFIQASQNSLNVKGDGDIHHTLRNEESLWFQSSRRNDTQSPFVGASPNNQNGSPHSIWKMQENLSGIEEIQFEDDDFEDDKRYDFEIDIKSGMYIKYKLQKCNFKPLLVCSEIIHKSDIYLNLFVKKGKINMELKLTQHQNEEEKKQKYDIEIDESIEFDQINFVNIISSDIKQSIQQCPVNQRKTLFMQIIYNKNILTSNMKEAIAKSIPFPLNSDLYVFQYEKLKPINKHTIQFKDAIDRNEKLLRFIIIPRGKDQKQKQRVYIWNKVKSGEIDFIKGVGQAGQSYKQKLFTFEEDLANHTIQVDKHSLKLLSLKSFIQKSKLKLVALTWSGKMENVDQIKLLIKHFKSLPQSTSIKIIADQQEFNYLSFSTISQSLLDFQSLNIYFKDQHLISEKEGYIFRDLSNSQIQIDEEKIDLAQLVQNKEKYSNSYFLQVLSNGLQISKNHIIILCKELQNIQQIQHLNLQVQNNCIQADGSNILFTHMKQYTQLVHLELDIGNNQICDEGVEYCSGFINDSQKLKVLVLNLKMNNMTGKGLNCLAQALQNKNKLLELKIDLQQNIIDSKQIQILADCLKNKKKLNSLEINLNKNNIQTQGCVQIFQSISNLKNISILNLYFESNCIQSQALNELSQMLLNINQDLHTFSLNLGRNKLNDSNAFNQLFSSIQNFVYIKELNLQLNNCWFPQSSLNNLCSCLEKIRKVQVLRLNLSKNYINDDGINIISLVFQKVSLLKELELDLSDNVITNSALEIVKSIFTYLNVAEILNINLKEAFVSKQLKNPVGLFTPSQTSIKSIALNLGNSIQHEINQNVYLVGYLTLLQNVQQVELNLENCIETDNVLKKTFKQVFENQNFTKIHLNLKGTRVKNNLMIDLKNNLKQQKNLENLNLNISNNNLNVENLNEFFDKIKCNANLKFLQLSIEDNTYDPIVFCNTFGNQIIALEKLESIDIQLGQQAIDMQEADYLSSCYPEQLRSLKAQIQFNSTESLKSYFTGISKYKQLEYLDLSFYDKLQKYQDIADAINSFAEIIIDFKKLKVLKIDFSGCDFSIQNMSILMKGLQKLDYIEELNVKLEQSLVSDDCILTMIEYLQNFNKLNNFVINLKKNDISPKGVLEILNWALSTISLYTLQINLNQEIQGKLMKNAQIQSAVEKLILNNKNITINNIEFSNKEEEINISKFISNLYQSVFSIVK